MTKTMIAYITVTHMLLLLTGYTVGVMSGKVELYETKIQPNTNYSLCIKGIDFEKHK